MLRFVRLLFGLTFLACGMSLNVPREDEAESRMGIRSIKPLKMDATTFKMGLPLSPSLGELDYPGQSVLDALWSGGSWSMVESVVAGLIFDSFCGGEIGEGVMIDGGAHVGYFTHFALAKGCKVIAVEPFKDSRDFVQFTAELNGRAGDLTVVPAVVSDEDDEVGRSFDGWRVSDGGKEMVQSVRLDTVFSTLFGSRRSRPVYVKLDVEGHESEALSGMGSLLGENGALSVYVELTTFEVKEGRGRKSQAMKAAEMVGGLMGKGYMVMGLEGGWGEKFEFLRDGMGVEEIASLLVSSQATGCHIIGVCITELIAVQHSIAGDFEALVRGAVEKERAAVKESIARRVMDVVGDGGTKKKVGDDVVPFHEIYVKDSEVGENGPTFKVEYPLEIDRVEGWFKSEGGSCEEMGLNVEKCEGVLGQVKQFILEWAARQLGSGELADRKAF